MEPAEAVCGHAGQPAVPARRGLLLPVIDGGRHAAIATVAWFAWPRLGQVLAAATVITSFGCVYVSVHYTSDVIAGALIGAAAAAVTWALSGLSVPGGTTPL